MHLGIYSKCTRVYILDVPYSGILPGMTEIIRVSTRVPHSIIYPTTNTKRAPTVLRVNCRVVRGMTLKYECRKVDYATTAYGAAREKAENTQDVHGS